MGGSSQPNTFLHYVLTSTINTLEPNSLDTPKFVKGTKVHQLTFLQV